jgi:hypothetical protein
MWVTQARVDRDREILLLGAAQPKVLGLAQGWRWLGVELKERWGGLGFGCEDFACKIAPAIMFTARVELE